MAGKGSKKNAPLIQETVRPLEASFMAAAITPPEADVDQKIRSKDADFRRRFAFKLLGLLAAIVIVALAGYLVAALAVLQNPDDDFPKALAEAIGELFPVAFSGVMGVFGTVVGFYFASGKNK
jgi:hypothetical protein